MRLKGFRCQVIPCEGAENFTEGVELNDEERNAPATCARCKKVMCDMCAFPVKVPSHWFGEPFGTLYDGFVCSDHFDDRMVDAETWSDLYAKEPAV